MKKPPSQVTPQPEQKIEDKKSERRPVKIKLSMGMFSVEVEKDKPEKPSLGFGKK